MFVTFDILKAGDQGDERRVGAIRVGTHKMSRRGRGESARYRRRAAAPDAIGGMKGGSPRKPSLIAQDEAKVTSGWRKKARCQGFG